MLPYFWYLLKVIICSGILFGYYWLFLRNKIFHQYNRFYLLAAAGLSLLVPLLKINFWQQGAQSNQAIRVLQAVSVGDEYMNGIVVTANKNTWSIEQFYPLLYWMVSLVFFIVLLRTIYIISTLLKQYPVQQIEEVTFVNTDDDRTPFSFFNYIFWNSSIDMSTTTGRQIFKHEIAHIQQKHTYDKLFVNILLIFCWCNPFFWLYRKELNMIHEFIADKKAVEDGNTTAFANMILQAAYPKYRFELINNFFYSPIKRRLLMLTKIDNPRVSYFARLMVLPLVVLVFAAFTFKAKTNPSLYHGKKITVVIDAGHGGKDFGAKSSDGIYEKDLTLAIAKKVKELNSNGDIEIILTRNSDIFMSPKEKADFTKSNNADLSISFHVDNGPPETANTKTGLNLWIAKDEKSQFFGSVTLGEFMNNGYQLDVDPEIKQRKVGIFTLQANTCPSVLIETGFINNAKDVAYLKTNAAKETIANNVLMAIEKYLTSKPNIPVVINSVDTVPNPPPPPPPPARFDPELKSTDTKPDVELLTSYKSLFYIGIPNHVYVAAKNIRTEDISLKISPTGSLSGSKGEYKVTVTSIGKTTISVFNNKTRELIKSFDYEVKRIPDPYDPDFPPGLKVNTVVEPRIFLGKFRGGRISMDDLKSQKEIRVSQGFSFVSAYVWFTYPESKTVSSAHLKSSSLLPIDEYIAKCVDGSTIMFDNVYVQDNIGNNKLVMNPPGFSVFDNTKIKATDESIAKAINNEKLNQRNDDNKIFTVAEVPPQFTGGKDEWLKFLRANLKVNTPVDNGAGAGKYSVVVKFIIHTDGSVSDVKFEKDPGFGTGDEAVRLIKETGGKWTAAVQNGRKVNAYHKQPITFLVED